MFVGLIYNDLSGSIEKTLGLFDEEQQAEDACQMFIDHKAKVWDEFQHLSYEVRPMQGVYAAMEAETRAACPEYAENGSCIHSDHTK